MRDYQRKQPSRSFTLPKLDREREVDTSKQIPEMNMFHHLPLDGMTSMCYLLWLISNNTVIFMLKPKFSQAYKMDKKSIQYSISKANQAYSVITDAPSGHSFIKMATQRLQVL